MQTTVNGKKTFYTTKVIVHNDIVATLRWGEDSKCYVSYCYLFDQEDIYEDTVQPELVDKIVSFCNKKQLTLWSY